MGQEIIAAVCADPRTTLVATYESPQHPRLGETAADGIFITTADNMKEHHLDALIDFTVPAASLQLTTLCEQHGVASVIGTTGFTEAEKLRLHELSSSIAIVLAPNMSVGVNALFELAEHAAKLLQAGALGGGYDMEVFETHHRNKKDAPSGTALYMGELLARTTGVDFSTAAVHDRHGREYSRKEHEIGFSVVRGGDIVGEHRAIFAGNGEQLEIVHRSTSRTNYAIGALRAALFAANATPGMYNMSAVLDVNKSPSITASL